MDTIVVFKNDIVFVYESDSGIILKVYELRRVSSEIAKVSLKIGKYKTGV